MTVLLLFGHKSIQIVQCKYENTILSQLNRPINKKKKESKKWFSMGHAKLLTS